MGSALLGSASLLILFVLSCALWADSAKIQAECWVLASPCSHGEGMLTHWFGCRSLGLQWS